MTMDIIFNIEPLEIFKNTSEEILTKLYDSKQSSTNNLEPHLIQAAKEDIKKLLFDGDFDMKKVAELLENKGWDQNKVNCLLSILEKRKTELLYTVLIHHNTTYGESVTDFDWFLKLVLGTNDLKILRYPLFQLLLSTVNSNGQQKQRVYDVNKDMLAKIISLLESIE